MGYLIAQLAVTVALTSVIAFLIGFWLQRARMIQAMHNLERLWSEKVKQANLDKRYLQSQLSGLDTARGSEVADAAGRWDQRFSQMVAERDAALGELRRLQSQQQLAQVSRAKAKVAEEPEDPERDNLKLIRGIGPGLEKRLNGMGVVRFKQIAAWSPDDMNAFAAKLPELLRRVDRSHWIEEARELHNTKYGEPL